MRILCLSNMYPGPGNPDYGAFIREMCDALDRRGHAVQRTVIDARAGGPLGTPAKYAGLLRRGMAAARDVDVVYAHYLFPTGPVAAAVHRVTGVPWVITAHGGDVANLARRPLRTATRLGLHGCAGIIAVSRYLADGLRESGIHGIPVHVAHMGVNVHRFTPASREAARAQLGIPAGVPLVLAVGGLTDRKDPLGLLQAVARLRTTRPEVRVAFVGDGPLAAALGPAARHLGIPADHVIRTGALPHPQVVRWVAAADVLSMVSRVEPLGVVALEALAAGRPVVATAVGGAREVVPARGPGRVVDPGNPARHAAAMAELLVHPPTPDACRAVAVGGAVEHQAARVEAVLTRAAATRTAGSLRRQ